MPPVPRREAAPPRRALAAALAVAALALAACSSGASTGSSASGTGPAGAATTGTTAGRGAAATTRPPASSAAGATATTARRPARHVFPVQPVAGCGVHYGRVHHDYPATDIFARKGCRFVSPTDGVVTEVSRTDRWQPSTNRGADRGGRSVAVLGDDGVRYYGSHLSVIDEAVQPGVRVTAGGRLGLVGRTGNANNTCHLHLGVSPPCARTADWWIRRGVVWPWSYLDAWRAGEQKSP
ncbi:MAG TPA: M23 family metallopeptidase, partial [Actinomycetota bacterium]